MTKDNYEREITSAPARFAMHAAAQKARGHISEHIRAAGLLARNDETLARSVVIWQSSEI